MRAFAFLNMSMPLRRKDSGSPPRGGSEKPYLRAILRSSFVGASPPLILASANSYKYSSSGFTTLYFGYTSLGFSAYYSASGEAYSNSCFSTRGVGLTGLGFSYTGGFCSGMKFIGAGSCWRSCVFWRVICALLAVGEFRQEKEGISSRIFVFNIDSLS